MDRLPRQRPAGPPRLAAIAAIGAAIACVVFAPLDARGTATDAEPTLPSIASLVGPAPVIRDVRAVSRGEATVVTLVGTARLVARSINEPEEGPRRLVLDLPNVSSAVPSVTAVGLGPVERVRIGLNPRAPLSTQVTMDLSRPAPYHVESSTTGHDLTIVFDERVPDPIAALGMRPGGPPVPAAAPAARVAAASTIEPRAVQPDIAPPPAGPVSRILSAQTPPARQAQVVAAAAPPAAAAATTPVVEPTRFTGHPISLDFEGADLVAVLRTFGEISGLNLMIDPTVRGSVTTQLRDVPWDHALDMILRTNRLGYSVDGTIVRVAPLNVLASEEEERRKLAEAQALAGELNVMTRTLSYARANDLTRLLTDTVLSPRGSVQTDPRTNTLIINDLPERLQQADQLLTSLDRPEPQVEIEARIVQTTREFARQIGVLWSAAGRIGSLATDPEQVDITAAGLLPATGDVAGLLDVGLTGAVDLDVQLSALEREGQGRILSTPRVSTQNNVQAEITQGVQIPIQTVSNNTVTVQFRDAALTLLVTPQITAANTVIMQITVENAAPDFSRQVNNIPPIDTQRAITRVQVGDGETTVIGGIYVSREQATQDRTPGLHRIPLLGWLFKRDTLSDESRELLIFITPRVIRL